jgi:hypothetical protein
MRRVPNTDRVITGHGDDDEEIEEGMFMEGI